MTVPSVRLEGDWPPATPGNMHLPNSAFGALRGNLEALGVYGYLVSIGYAQDGASPLPEDIAKSNPHASPRELKAAFCDLAFLGLLRLVPDEAGQIVEIVLPLPGSGR